MPSFDADVRSALQGAREEALALGHGHVDSGHLLLGILRRPSSGLTTVLGALGVDPSTLTRETTSVLRNQPAPPATGVDFPYTAAAKRVLQAAMVEAQRLGHEEIGPEHLFLGLLGLGSPDEPAALRSAGITAERTRAAFVGFRPPTPGPRSSRSWMIVFPWWIALLLSIVALVVAIAALIVAVRR
jgi:ATP-dependent Clp protease ATP-binding subunit ClpA